MNLTFYEIAMLFFGYSFLAWLAETAVATVKTRKFRNRGFASGPFCFLYGFTGVLLAIFLQELKEDSPIFLFLGSMVVATAMEWFAGKGLEKMKRKKWWDYSGKRFQFDGYICLQYSLLWGLLGFLAVGAVDFAGSFMAVYHMEEKLPRLLGWNHSLQRWTFRLAAKVSARIERRMGRSYPSILQEWDQEKEKGAERCSFVQAF